MKSKAHIKTHPLHPILISFPVAFLSGTLLFDLLAVITGNMSLWQVGGYLEFAGVISAVVAAVPGVIDFKYTVPPGSSAKKRAARHGLMNSAMLIVFLAAYILRNNESAGLSILALEAVGTVLLVTAGWMGGTLVHRNHIGVYNRYANGGKWREARLDVSDGLVEAAEAGELKEDQMKLLLVGNKRIVLGRSENGYVAFEDRCSHKGGSLAGGTMICGTVQCPWHGSQFSTETGEVKAGPASQKINTYPTMQMDGKIYVRFSEP
ncbi:DUF2231 domain-containing protein [Arcticibacter tournemirensis]|uniref:DUF2231 domain-containing protein n=1 Tax=Arcticibacter tournemirensis TaxID=699437 RepID=A0A4Q0MGH1_9SPHI|nr:DUF2231 domain-containing protein [Arcticibacter tournemirensis]RXF72474.1 DUF2231 domain-containing protein [Arcticibacter tournemirensis]